MLDMEAARAATKERMAARRHNMTSLARAAEVDVKTVRGFLNDGRWPQQQSRAAIAAALDWPADALDRLAEGQIVGGSTQDAGYVSAPGARADHGESDDEVLQAIRDMRADLAAMRERLDQIEGS